MTKIMVMLAQSNIPVTKTVFLTAEGAIDFSLFFLFCPDLNYVIQTPQLSQSAYVLLWVNWIFNGTLICLI